MKATVEGNAEVGFLPTAAPDPLLLASLATEMAPLRPSRPDAFEVMVHTGARVQQVTTSVGTLPELLLELAGVKAAIRTWHQKQPDEVIREASAYSARLTELWTELRLLESVDRTYIQARTMQVQPVIDEIDRQVRMNQSRIAMMRQDLDMVMKGGG